MRKIVLAAALLSTSTAFAFKIEDPHFFGSVEAARTTTENDIILETIKNEWTISPLITAGANLSATIDEKSTGLVQFIKDDNKVVVDLIQYQTNLPYEIRGRFGKQRLPVFLMSEVIQVKALYPWTMAPHEVYNMIPVRSFSGFSFEKEFGNFMLHVFGGDASEQYTDGGIDYDVNTSEFYGTRLNYRLSNFESFISFIKTDVDVGIESKVNIAPGVNGIAEAVVTLENLEAYTAGVNWTPGKWWLLSEYVLVRTTDTALNEQSAAYGSLGYNFTDEFLLLGTFSSHLTKDTYLSPSKHTTYALNGQYKLNLNTVLKIGVSHVNYKERTVDSPLTATGQSSGAFGYSGSPGGNFQIYDVQLGFVF